MSMAWSLSRPTRVVSLTAEVMLAVRSEVTLVTRLLLSLPCLMMTGLAGWTPALGCHTLTETKVPSTI